MVIRTILMLAYVHDRIERKCVQQCSVGDYGAKHRHIRYIDQENRHVFQIVLLFSLRQKPGLESLLILKKYEIKQSTYRRFPLQYLEKCCLNFSLFSFFSALFYVWLTM